MIENKVTIVEGTDIRLRRVDAVYADDFPIKELEQNIEEMNDEGWVLKSVTPLPPDRFLCLWERENE